ncbi:MFS transporter [Pseudoclavibacter sp. 13-3]|uniref:MFS transporter n=1 Tax=Pseudoclavibacter sp. 13-3 TaxID=2901228 RepID=UPI001E2A5492|nr:MFS transporter [Pseudoclavibacter sp. 13-3]MCD7100653.1 MFS transporter [Pseudoclavibacter sp. 13-3]
MNQLRRYAVPIFLPALLFATAEACLVPVLPARAVELGADTALAGLIAGMLMIGQVLGDLPSSWLVARLGEQRTMIVAAALGAVGAAVAVIGSSVTVLLIGTLLVGMAAAAFNLARHALLTELVPVSHRARAMSVLGGTVRGGLFLGPMLVAPLVAWLGSTSAFLASIVLSILVAVLLLVMPDPEVLLRAGLDAETTGSGLTSADRPDTAHTCDAMTSAPSLWQTLVDSRHVLATMGLGIASVQLLRASRQVILPLWGTHIGADPETIALIMGVAGAVDLALFYVSGQLMDRFGRLWVVLPTLLGLALTHLALLPVHGPWGLMVTATLMSLANGLGSGIIMTMGADLAPEHHPAAFLGAWRLVADAGSASSPLILAGLTAAAGIAASAAVMAGLGIVGAWMLWHFTPKFLPPELSGRGRV